MHKSESGVYCKHQVRGVPSTRMGQGAMSSLWDFKAPGCCYHHRLPTSCHSGPISKAAPRASVQVQPYSSYATGSCYRNTIITAAINHDWLVTSCLKPISDTKNQRPEKSKRCLLSLWITVLKGNWGKRLIQNRMSWQGLIVEIENFYLHITGSDPGLGGQKLKVIVI